MKGARDLFYYAVGKLLAGVLHYIIFLQHTTHVLGLGQFAQLHTYSITRVTKVTKRSKTNKQTIYLPINNDSLCAFFLHALLKVVTSFPAHLCHQWRIMP